MLLNQKAFKPHFLGLNFYRYKEIKDEKNKILKQHTYDEITILEYSN